MNIDWAFQHNEDRTKQGWNDPTIAQFKSDRLESLTREIIQNSLDAKVDDKSPVYVDFQEKTIQASQIPGLETLRHKLELCYATTTDQERKNNRELSIALDLVKRSKIPVLSVSDYNTSGMEGPCEDPKPFFRYLKTVGDQGGQTNRAGSHGIGKGAPLACSDLRTIIVSTKWMDEKKNEQALVQGRAVLMSYEENGKVYKSTGFWGDKENYQALSPSQVPDDNKWLLRDAIGTTVHIIGWNRIEKDNWDKLIIGFAIRSYFAAFMRGKLVVKVNNHEINKDTVYDLLKNPTIISAMKKVNGADKFQDTAFYMRCLSNDTSIIHEETQLIHLGRTGIDMMIAEDAPRKIALIRNNMLITDSLPGFWQRIPARFKDFVGIVEVRNEDGSQLIRSMEPPRHDSLSSDFLPTDDERKKAKLALDKLSDELKKFVERHAGTSSDDFGNATFMAEFFADEAGDDSGEKIGDETDPNGNFIFQPKAIKFISLPKITLESEVDEEIDSSFGEAEEAADQNGEAEANGADDTGAGGAGVIGGDRKVENHVGKGAGDGDGGTDNRPKTDRRRDKPSHPVQLRNVRVIKLSNIKARIFATPSDSAKSVIRVHECGSDFDDPFDVVSTNRGDVIDGAVMISMKNGERLDISVELSRNIVGGLKIVASQPGEQKGDSK